MPNSRRLLAAALLLLAPAATLGAPIHGIGLNPTSDVKGLKTPDQMKVILDDLGVKSIRAWMTISNWSTPPSSSAFDMYRQYKQRGYTVMVVFALKENSSSSMIPTYAQAKAYFNAAATNANGAVDYWEIGNEPNLTQYWPGGSANMTPYVDQMLKGAWDALKPRGLKVVGAGVCCDTAALQKLVSLHYLDYVDYANFHPYGGYTQQHIDRVKAARTIVGAKPLFLSEWNIQGGSDLAKWAASVGPMYTAIEPLVQGVWYFRTINASATPASAGSTLNADLSKNVPFYNAVRAAYAGSISPTGPYTLSVSAVNGSVAKSPSQASYASGTAVTLTATPASGYAFSSWSGSLTGATNPATITMSANKTITANFTAAAPAPLPALAAPSISLSCSGTEPVASYSWAEAGRGSSGYVADLDVDTDWLTSTWTKNVSSGTLTTTAPAGFTQKYAGGPAFGSLQAGHVYYARMYYFATREYSPVATFTAPSCAVAPASFSLALANAATNAEIRALDEGATIDLSADGASLTILAKPTVAVGSFGMKLDSGAVRYETNAPYALCGDAAGGDLLDCALSVGDHVVTVTPYSGSAGSGTAGTAIVRRFTISQGAAPTPTPTPTPTPIDSTGWTPLTQAAGGRKYYVAASGLDGNSGLDSNNPTSLKTIADALLNGKLAEGDWVLFKRGDTFPLTSSLRMTKKNMLLGAYGTGSRPKIVSMGTLDNAIALSAVSGLSIVDLHLTASNRDPSVITGSNAFVSGKKMACGIDGREMTNLLIEGNLIEFFRQNICLHPPSGVVVSGLRMRRNVIRNSYDEGGGVAVGLYANGISGALIEENVFDTNGWDPRLKVTYLNTDGTLNTSRLQFHHGIYYGNYTRVPVNPIIRRNVFYNSASSGLQQRTGGVMDDNLFITNGTAADGFTEGLYGEIVNNVVLGSKEPPAIATKGGLMFTSASGIMANNIVAHGAASETGAAYFQGDPSTPETDYVTARNASASSATIVNNIMHDWGGEGFKIYTLRSRNVFSNNAFSQGRREYMQLHVADRAVSYSNNTYAAGVTDKMFRLANNYLYPFSSFESSVAGVGDKLGVTNYFNPGASIETYAQSVGLAGSVSAFIAKADQLDRNSWDARFTAPAVNDYIRQAFRKVSTTVIATASDTPVMGSASGAPVLVYLRSGASGGYLAPPPSSQPKALLLDFKTGGRDALVFSPTVTQVAILGLDGRTYFSASASGGRLVVPIDSSLRLPTGYSLLKTVDEAGQSSMVAVVRAR